MKKKFELRKVKRLINETCKDDKSRFSSSSCSGFLYLGLKKNKCSIRTFLRDFCNNKEQCVECNLYDELNKIK